jgi:TPR repeat protein
MSFLRAAAEAGSMVAAEALAAIYEDGDYIRRDATAVGHWLTQAAALGSHSAMRLLARRKLDGIGMPADPVEGRRLIEAAALAGDRDAQLELGKLLQAGRWAEPDIRTARIWVDRAAAQGSGEALAWLGDVHKQGLDGPADPVRAEACYRQAIARGYIGAMAALAMMKSADPADTEALAQSLELWLQAARAGDARAHLMVAEAYLAGRGAAADPAEAVRWLTIAAEAGFGDAEARLGSILLQQSEGVAERQAEALKWLRSAAAKGHPDAQYNLGVCYRRGLGVPKNRKKAQGLYLRAAEQGQASAQLALGDLLLEIGADSEAAGWYAKAVSASPIAAFSLAQLCAVGRGVPRDDNAAMLLCQEAASRGHQPAIEALKALDSLIRRAS